jgi:N12 class adenine-specific DNA methylase
MIFQHVYALEDLLRAAISEAAAGEYDGHQMDHDGSEGHFYMYGPDAEVLFRVISPVMAKFSFMHGATVTLWFGPPKRATPKRIIELP